MPTLVLYMQVKVKALVLATRCSPSCLKWRWKHLVVHPQPVAKNRHTVKVEDAWIFPWGGDNSRLQFAQSNPFSLMCKLQWLGQLKSGDVISLPCSEIYRSHMSISVESSAFYFESVGWKSAQSAGLGIQQLVMRVQPVRPRQTWRERFYPIGR